jgi:imidazolonepropionase-like amidohydrolase
MFRVFVAVLLSMGSFECVAGAPAADPIAITHVNVLPMTPAGAPHNDMTVTIRNGRIVAITATAGTRVPKGVRAIDGRGKWLMPGFSDMHMHLENDRMGRLHVGDPTLPDGTFTLEDALTPYLANGVTQIFSLASMSETIGQRVEVESGRVPGPHIATAAMIDGSPPMWPLGMTRAAATPADGRQAVRDAKAEGYDFIKVYSKLTLETFSAIVDEARQQHMRVVGHIPGRGQGITEKFFQPGFDLVAHAEEFAQHTDPPDHSAIPRYVEMAKRNGTWLVATLSLDERIVEEMRDPESLKRRDELRHMHPQAYDMVINGNPYLKDVNAGRIAYVQAVVDFNCPLVKAFVDAGVPVLTGTDAPVPGLAPGFALHDEFEALSRCGMSNLQVLESTTRLSAEWLGKLPDRGTVETGKRADLVLLDANPLENISNTRRIAAVIANGHYLPRGELDRRLKRIADRTKASAAH